MKNRVPFFTLVLVALNLAAYLVELASGGQGICDAYGLVPARFVRSGDYAHLVSSMFLHDPSSLWHLGGNMVCLAVFGGLVERHLGHFQFLGVYLLAGALGGLMHVLVNPAATDALVGASGGIFGVMAVAAAIRPRLLGGVAAFALTAIWPAFMGGSGNVSFGCHIGGFCAGVLIVMLMKATDCEALEAA